MAITTGTIPQMLWPGINQFWGMSYRDFPSCIPKVYDQRGSNKKYEVDVENYGFTYFNVKQENGGISYDEPGQGYETRYTHVTYAKGYVITEEAIEDNQYMSDAKKFTRNLKGALMKTRELLGANVLNRATTAGYTGGDGQTLLSTAHTIGRGGTFSNRPTIAADISESALEDAFIAVRDWTDSSGMKANIQPKFVLGRHDIMFDTHRILNAVQRVGTANNDPNALKDMNAFPDGFVDWVYLSDTDAWFILTDVDDGLIYYKRRGDRLDKDSDFETGNAKVKATFRCSFGWTDPRCVYGSPGA